MATPPNARASQGCKNPEWKCIVPYTITAGDLAAVDANPLGKNNIVYHHKSSMSTMHADCMPALASSPGSN